MLGAFFAYTGVRLGLPLAVAALCSVALTTAVGMLIERVALRPLENAPWIAPLLSTLAITFMLDQAAEIIWTPEAHPFPNPLSAYSVVVGAAYVTGMDAAILVISLLDGGAVPVPDAELGGQGAARHVAGYGCRPADGG